VRILVLWLALAWEAGAQQPASSSEEQEQLPAFREDVLVRARAPASPAATVTVIDREAIESSQARTVDELLEQVAGVHILTSGSRGGSSSAQIRGGDPNFTLVLLDGVPLNDSTDLEGGAVNLKSLPTSSIERIEVARGPLSYFYGSSALGGVIHIMTRRRAGERVRLSADGGDASFFRATAAASGSAGRSEFYVGAGWEQEQERVADESFDQLNFQGTVSVPLGSKASLRLAGRAASWDAVDYPEASGGPIYGTGEVRHSEHGEWSLGADVALPTGGNWKHRASATFYHHDLDRESPGTLPLVPPSREGTSYLRARFGWLTSVEVSPSVQWSAGVDLESENGSNESTLLLPPEFGGEVPGDYDLSRTTPGAFTEVVAEKGRLLVELGLRADIPEDTPVEWSPRVGARYRIFGGTSFVRGSLSRAFKLPSFFVLGSPPALGGNPELNPETSLGFDLGVEHRTESGTLDLYLGVFLNEFRNLIDFDFDRFTHVNRSRVEARGVELTATVRPVDELALGSNLTWQSVDDPQSTSPPLNQPEWTAGVRATWTPLSSFTLRGEGHFVSSSFDRQLPVPEIDSVDGYAVWDAAATWRFSSRWEIRGRIDNLTNESYQTFVGFPEPGRSFWAGVQVSLP
jgi:outer membrane cobalamin receptor